MERDTHLLQEQLQHRALQLGGAVLASTAFFGAGALVGAGTPSTVELGPGLQVDASAQHAGSTKANFGALGTVYFPKISYAGFGVDITVHPIEVNTQDPETLGFYAALKTNPEEGIKKPIVESIRNNALIGGGIGLAAEGVLGLGALAWRESKKRKHTELGGIIERLRATSGGDPDSERALTELAAYHNPAKRNLRAKAIVGGACLALIVNCHGDRRYVNSVPAGVPLTPILGKDFRLFDDARIEGKGAELLINTGAEQVNSYINKTNAFYDKANQNITHAFQNLRHKKGDILLDDPVYTTAMIVSDMHCNTAMSEKSFGKIAQTGSADVIFNLGDTDTSLGELPYEKECGKKMAEAINPDVLGKEVRIVSVIGNHDSQITANNQRAATVGKDKFKPFIVLDKKNPAAHVEGLNIVSGPFDPRQSGFGRGMTPSDPAKQKEAVAKQGDEIADNACKSKEESGVAPIVLAHDREATYAAITKACATGAFAGHMHAQDKPKRYELMTDTGADVTTFTQGTSAGAGPGALTQYSPPTTEAPYTFFMFDRETNSPVGYYNLVIKTNAEVTLSGFKKLPKAKSLPPEIITKTLETGN